MASPCLLSDSLVPPALPVLSPPAFPPLRTGPSECRDLLLLEPCRSLCRCLAWLFARTPVLPCPLPSLPDSSIARILKTATFFPFLSFNFSTSQSASFGRTLAPFSVFSSAARQSSNAETRTTPSPRRSARKRRFSILLSRTPSFESSFLRSDLRILSSSRSVKSSAEEEEERARLKALMARRPRLSTCVSMLVPLSLLSSECSRGDRPRRLLLSVQVLQLQLWSDDQDGLMYVHVSKSTTSIQYVVRQEASKDGRVMLCTMIKQKTMKKSIVRAIVLPLPTAACQSLPGISYLYPTTLREVRHIRNNLHRDTLLYSDE